MERKVRVGAVSYLNTLPLVYGFADDSFKKKADVTFDYPANVAKKLIENKIDIGLIPVAAIPQVADAEIVGDYCIGASQAVATVCIFSDVPLEKVETIFLDYQSRTSVALTKVLLNEYWKMEPRLVDAAEGFEQKIDGTTAAVVIGDRAFSLAKKHPFVYDLAAAWIAHTGLSFVFAAWVANKKLPEEFKQQFNTATGEGLHHVQQIAAAQNYQDYDLYYYYTQNIDYRLDDKKKAAIGLFLEKVEILNN